MNIRVLKNSGRRCAWTDRRNGYFEYFCSENATKNGYYRGDKRLLGDFTISGHSISESKYIDITPYGFTACYDDTKINISLLIDERAFFISGAKNPGLRQIIPIFEHDLEKLNDILTKKEKFADVDSEMALINGEITGKTENQQNNSYTNVKIPEWHNSVVDGITILSSDTGLCIASQMDFYANTNAGDVELYSRDGKVDLGWYVVFENNENSAQEKAIRLAKNAGINAHKKQIDDFFAKCKVDFGDEKFNEAVQWARFSGWMLATKDCDSNYRGIWAGLPWFRDNWGRDTFICLCGILLSSGCIDEARDVLMGFAGFQDLDEKSPTYGRIPNRYRNKDDVIYNTVDGTLWFIRALWEYVQYSGDIKILNELSKTVEIALDAEIQHTDERGFLTHADADTWMDAKIMGENPWSPRGNRANDIQALWFTALNLGSYIMKMNGNAGKSTKYVELAEKVKKSFSEYFWSSDNDAVADHLLEGGYGEWAKDLRVRPNQLFAITAPQILPNGNPIVQSESVQNEQFDIPSKTEKSFISKNIVSSIMKNVNRELVSPFGLYSLSPEDPLFHAEHENPAMYHKDAAYHNGTIWEWNAGPYISAVAITSKGILPEQATSILQNESKMIMDWGCAGTLSENIHARPDEDGNPKLSGTFSQGWSVAEFTRNILQDIIGFNPRLAENKIEFRPCLPSSCKNLSAKLPFGKIYSMSIKIERKSDKYDCELLWNDESLSSNQNSSDKEQNTFTGELFVNGQKIELGKKLSLKIKCEKSSSVEKFGCPSKWITHNFIEHDLCPDWNGAEHKKNYLKELILSGRMKSKCCAGENTAALEWFFDSEEFNKKYATDIELGAIFDKKKTVFRVWAPTARYVELILYPTGNDSEATKKLKMTRLSGKNAEGQNLNGVWEITVDGNLHGTYYEYGLYVHGVYNHSFDPYAHAAGVNGNRSMVCDMSKTNPEGWYDFESPTLKSPNDAIIYEAHIADMTSSPYWNGSEKNRRLFTGFAEKGTSYDGVPTGFDHIKNLGVTHVQLLPIFDFRSVDETRMNDENYKKQFMFGTFNWGYDPQNYGLPEGSYSSNPYDGEVRIRELKTLIMSLAKEGIGVVMDVVFNHVNNGLKHGFEATVPGYFYRVEGYSGAGEDTASEHIMYSKYMVNMLAYWLKEYKLSGFRFDLMGLHDVNTLNNAEKTLRKIKKDVLVYGEGWKMYNANKMIPADQTNASKMPNVSHFNDAFRDGLKGDAFKNQNPGFIHNGSFRESIKFGIVGATAHPQVDNSKVEGTVEPNPWSTKTWININYTEIHDNSTMNDKIHLVEENRPEEYYEQLAKFAISFILLSEGLPILHAGMEFLRTKQIPEDLLQNDLSCCDYAKASKENKTYLRNTYNICDRINALDWKRCAEKRDLVDYVRKLIALRKEHRVFKISSGSVLEHALEFIDNYKVGLPKEVLAWQINGADANVKDKWKSVVLIANPLNYDVKYELPRDITWLQITDGVQFNETQLESVNGSTVVTLKPKTLSVFAN